MRGEPSPWQLWKCFRGDCLCDSSRCLKGTQGGKSRERVDCQDCYRPWDRLLALTCRVSCKSDNRIKGGCIWWSSRMIDRECGNWLWFDLMDWLIDASQHYSWLPRCCFIGWCHRFLIDRYVLPRMALPQILVFILPCSLVGTASWVSCLNIIVVFSPLPFPSARS